MAYSRWLWALTKPGQDDRLREALALAELRRGPTAAIRPSSSIATAPSRIGVTLDRDDPVGGEDPHRAPPLEQVLVPVALPAPLHDHGEPDRHLEEDQERDHLEGERDRVDGRQQDREHEQHDEGDPAVAAETLRAEDAQPHEPENEDRHEEREAAREQRPRRRTSSSSSRGSGCRRARRRSSSGSRAHAGARRST